ncbi:hypothetical protein H0H87_002675, partial [Tephrocybe sp. NHM501043]
MHAVVDQHGPCFGANPDVSGIGIRTTIYAQNLLSFAPALLTLKDGKVTPTELDALETQSTTILITAFAILVSTIIQASTSTTSSGISNYHTSIVLDLSWMNNTNLFIYLLLYTYCRVNLNNTELSEEAKEHLQLPTRRLARWIYKVRKLVYGSGAALLDLAVSSQQCSLSASVVVIGRAVPLGSAGLRTWSILIYSTLLIPFFNLLIPVVLFAVPLFLFQHSRHMELCRIMIGLGILVIIDVILLFDTEWGIRHNMKNNVLGQDDGGWIFGQTLALLLLLVPLRDLGEALWERRAKSLGERLFDASEKGKIDVVEYVLGLGPQKDAIDSSIVPAVKNSHWDIVNIFLRHEAKINDQ